MSVRNHRIAAVSILAAGVVVLLAWGRSMAVESDEVRIVRDKLQGGWVATLVQAGEHRKREGKAAETCRVEFDGKEVVFHHLIGDIDARGTYFLDRQAGSANVDFKLDAGWIVGLYEVDGDTLKLCLNALGFAERLGVPNRPRARRIHAGDDRQLYVFRRATPEF
jgi:uncharacterized protein (TIGR03067 family)